MNLISSAAGRRAVRLGVLALGAAMGTPERAISLCAKAVRICLECVGIG